jgi:hypothetical protein
MVYHYLLRYLQVLPKGLVNLPLLFGDPSFPRYLSWLNK